jgi:hypothetical protein
MKAWTVMTARVAALLLFVTGCKSTGVSRLSNFELEADAAAGPTPVILVFGGSWSCGQNAEQKPAPAIGNGVAPIAGIFEAVRQAVKAKNKSPSVDFISCYTADPTQVHYILNATKSVQVKSGSVDGMFAEMRSMLAATARPEVILIGHGYGGWMAMEFARTLPPSLPIHLMVTLDPISMKTCTSDIMIHGTRGKNARSGCSTSPKDFPSDDIMRISERTGNWLNYYQTSSVYLHSAAIEDFGKVENIRMDYENSPDTLGGHLAFLIDGKLIGEIIDATLSALSSPKGS